MAAIGADEKKKLMLLGGLIVLIIVVVLVLYNPFGGGSTPPPTSAPAPLPTRSMGGSPPPAPGAPAPGAPAKPPAPAPAPAAPGPAAAFAGAPTGGATGGTSAQLINPSPWRPDPFAPPDVAIPGATATPMPPPTPIPPVPVPQPGRVVRPAEVPLPYIRPGVGSSLSSTTVLSTIPPAVIPRSPKVPTPPDRSESRAGGPVGIARSTNKRLSGIIIGDGVRALLEIGSGDERVTRIVQPGDEVDGISILRIERNTEGGRTTTRMVIRETTGEERYVELRASPEARAPAGGADETAGGGAGAGAGGRGRLPRGGFGFQ